MSIGVAWIGEGAGPDRLIEAAVAALAREFATSAQRVRVDGPRPQAFDPKRGQHSSRVMLAWLAGQVGARDRLLGMTAVDLFIPVLTFVFGEAQLGGRVAVMSLARLTEAADPARLAARVVKEAVHEVGHTYGLVHCAALSCVMSRSPGLRSVDLKGDRLCAECRVRYRELTERSHVPDQGPHPDR